MKKNLATLLLLFIAPFIFASSLHAQGSDDDILQERLNKYYSLTEQQQYDEMMAYIYPKIFTIVPKDQLVKAFEEVLEGIKFNFSDLNTVWIEEIHSEDYRLIKYSADVEFLFISEETKDEDFITMMAGFLGSQPGYSNLESDLEQFSISAETEKYILALNEDEYPGWHFMEFDESNPRMLNLLLAPELIQTVSDRIEREN